MRAAAEPVHFVDEPRGYPNAAQLAAVEAAERRA
jgi:hypothetical protein